MLRAGSSVFNELRVWWVWHHTLRQVPTTQAGPRPLNAHISRVLVISGSRGKGHSCDWSKALACWRLSVPNFTKALLHPTSSQTTPPAQSSRIRVRLFRARPKSTRPNHTHGNPGLRPVRLRGADPMLTGPRPREFWAGVGQSKPHEPSLCPERFGAYFVSKIFRKTSSHWVQDTQMATGIPSYASRLPLWPSWPRGLPKSLNSKGDCVLDDRMQGDLRW